MSDPRPRARWVGGRSYINGNTVNYRRDYLYLSGGGARRASWVEMVEEQAALVLLMLAVMAGVIWLIVISTWRE